MSKCKSKTKDSDSICKRCLKRLDEHVVDLGSADEALYLCSDKQESLFNCPSLVILNKSENLDVENQIDKSSKETILSNL